MAFLWLWFGFALAAILALFLRRLLDNMRGNHWETKKPKPRVREGVAQAAGIFPQTLVFWVFGFPMVLLKFLGSALGFFGFR